MPAPLRILLDFYHPWSHHAPLFAARAQGFWAGLGQEVEIACGDPFRGDALAYLERGEVDFGLSYPNRLMARVAEGADLVALCALTDRPLESITWREERGFTRPRDLEGQRVGYRRSARMTALLNHLVEKDGGDPQRVNHVVMYPAEPMPSDLESGEIDAMFGALWAWEGLHGPVMHGLRLAHAEVHEWGAPRYNAQVLVARRATAERFGLAVVDGWRNGVTWVQNHEPAALELMEEAAPYFAPALLMASLETMREVWGDGSFRRADLEVYHRWLLSVGLVARPVDLDATFWEPRS